MERALRTAASGMFAQQINIDIIAHNLANVNTTSFKRSRAEFQDLMYQILKAPSSSSAQDRGVENVSEIQVGTGVQTVATLRDFKQGDLQPTNNPLDIAINGEGFFQVRKTDGTIAYTRDGSFKLSRDGRLVNSSGYVLEPEIIIPETAVAISISRDGIVEVLNAGETEPIEIGRIELVRFVNPAGLRSIGNNLYVETQASGQPIFGTPGSESFGELMQGYLEASNVDIVEEMVNMIIAQRAYEINSKTIKTVEEMLQMANNLKR
ncbi:MAG: flagellar basal-body rod protein FlgG [Candidatus Kryptonium sp.]|nr:flagellar basal-body rod protein FlgG [Candidatus Kryptonium sp.]MCX7762085.1 flagellar basal-body rod protein FlgG [Candidatus Kryptonium sp.]MDW8108311.1 flagellar basal-body rod protein FlgG [Candidatus Kryptonium sp.]